MKTPLRLLVIEDSEADFLLLERYLRQHGIEAACLRVASDAELAAALQQPWDAVLSDYKLPGMQFAEVLHRLKADFADVPVILVSGSVGEEKAVELLKQGVTDFIIKDDLSRLPAAVQRAIGEAREHRARRDAEAALYNSQQQALDEQRRARMAALNLMEDAIAARDRAEAAHLASRESEKKYRLLSSNAADWIFWLGTDGRFQYVSPACATISAYAAEEFLADAALMSRIIEADDRARYLSHLEHGDRIDADELEFRIVRKDGTVRWIAHHCQPMYDEQGRCIGRSGTNRDITTRKQAEAQRNLLSEALRQSATPLLLADAETRITYMNPAFSRLFGYDTADLQGRPVSVLVPQNEAAIEEQKTLVQEIRRVGNWSGEAGRLARDGTLIPTAASIGSILDTDGKLAGFVASYLDLRPLREKELMLRQLALAIEQSPESIAITNIEANIEYVNEAFVRNTGYSREELIGKNPRVLHSGKTPKSTYDELWCNLAAGKSWEGKFYNRRKDGSEYIEHAIIGPIRQPDGTVTHYVAVKEDITDKIRAEAEIHRLAFYDTLTGLPNRALLLERMTQTLATTRRLGHQSALISFNIDRFKNVNDAGGQALGDALLNAAGKRLQQQLREGDVLARIAGDEFGILLTDLAPDKSAAAHHALHVAEKIHAALAAPFPLGNERINISACLGIVLFSGSEVDTPLDVLRRANTALHHAKTRGTGQTSFFDNTLDEVAKHRFHTERELHRALAEGELRVFLQPQVNADAKIVGAEALVRWQHPQRGIVPPGAFIPIAEESNLIIEIGTWMLTEVCRLLTREALLDLPLRIAVNISPRQFRQHDFVSQVRHILAITGADPMHLTLEVTEGLVIDNMSDVIGKMNELSGMGIHFSMDDFGTGYSSLSYLKRLPIHELKIDKSFIQDLTTDANDAALVETILAVAKHMHLKVVAEGVETAEQAAFLNQRASVIHQGYLYGKPEPAEAMLAKLSG